MKLYSANLSPYATRVRIAIAAKGLSIETVSPPGGLKSPEYLAVNPMGKIPCLVLDDGTSLPESEVIVEYLDDAFPARPLRPANAADAARARLLARMADLYLMTAGLTLFGQMNPATRDQATVDAGLASIDGALANMETFMGPGPYAVGKSFSTADCALAPVFFFMGVFGQVFGRGDLLAGHPKLSAYWRHLQTDPAVKPALGEMQAALAERMAPAR
ncbi:MAG: glutathione S-transferase family protein [Caulobacterales bacterium]